MQDLQCELEGHVFILTLNRTQKHNAFDDKLINALQKALNDATQNPEVRVILLRANGRHFSAGADLGWMQKMAGFSEAENIKDAKALAKLLSTFYHSQKPTVAVVQGAAMGGGAGLVAACDIVIAAENAAFCFSEVKLGLIPAVISPYVVHAVGARTASWLFMSAQKIDAKTAQLTGLVQQIVPEEELAFCGHEYAKQLAALPPNAVSDAKALVKKVLNQPIDEKLETLTATLIAKKRASDEGRAGMQAFLNKD